MRQFHTRRPSAFTADQMFDLVADVRRYPKFVPLCTGLSVLDQSRDSSGNEIITARMHIAYKLFREEFSCRVLLNPTTHEIITRNMDGPFKQLENIWRFNQTADQKCVIEFSLTYELKSKSLQLLVGAVFDKAFSKFATAFEQRAEVVYGKCASKLVP